MRCALLNNLRRLRKDESGNVLYMTLILVLMLASFTLVAANVIYMGVMKAKAQNAADQLAFSAAALKARLLNRIANYNALYHIALFGGTINATTPYPEPVEAFIAQGAMLVMYLMVHTYEIPKYSEWLRNRWLDRVARESGMSERSSRFGVYPVQMNLSDPYGLLGFGTELTAQAAPIKFMVPPLPNPFFLPFPITAIEPAYDWYVQSRVEWKTHKAAIGGKTLGIELPDIVTRSRADLFDKPEPAAAWLPGPVKHNWRVRLAKVDENVDREIRRRMHSQNTGQAQPSAPGAPSMPAGYEAWMDEHGEFSQEQFTEQMVARMSPFEQFKFYQGKLQGHGLSAKEKIKYYDLKQNIMGLSFTERMEYLYLKMMNR